MLFSAATFCTALSADIILPFESCSVAYCMAVDRCAALNCPQNIFLFIALSWEANCCMSAPMLLQSIGFRAAISFTASSATKLLIKHRHAIAASANFTFLIIILVCSKKFQYSHAFYFCLRTQKEIYFLTLSVYINVNEVL
jgi:hypothetical protein